MRGTLDKTAFRCLMAIQLPGNFRRFSGALNNLAGLRMIDYVSTKCPLSQETSFAISSAARSGNSRNAFRRDLRSTSDEPGELVANGNKPAGFLGLE
jgi:hypothetical protein